MTENFVETGTVLDRILARTLSDVAARKAAVPIDKLIERGADRPTPVGLRRAIQQPGVSVIAEIKRASPSRGVFPLEIDPPGVAADYLRGGAVAISVLTDEPFFHGSLTDLERASAVAHAHLPAAPVLRKDFIVDPYQLVEAWANGADAVLLIAAALTDDQLGSLMAAAAEQGLDTLVEVHDRGEMARAAEVGATLIGINNRNLHTFVVDLTVTEEIASACPDDAVLVSESGIFGGNDIRRLQQAGIDAFLVGEGVMVTPDRAMAVAELVAAGAAVGMDS